METLVVELPTTSHDWAELPGRELDTKVRELDVAARRVEAALVVRPSSSIAPVTTPVMGIARRVRG